MEKKTAVEIVIENFLKDVDEVGLMPWQCPYKVFYAFNWATMQPYKGINRLILPFGEYLTANQLNEYNKANNEDFRFQKGIKWYQVVYYKRDTKQVSQAEITKLLDSEVELKNSINSPNSFICFYYPWKYYTDENAMLWKEKRVLMYYSVADIKHFKNSKGETLPSRIESGEVSLTYSNANEVIDNYIENQGIFVNTNYNGVSAYVPSLDIIKLNPNHRTQEDWYSTTFHELAHSTGHQLRLNRDSLVNYNKENRPVEECIAEIVSGLLCSECGVYTFSTQESKEYTNNLAYVANWKKRILDWGEKFIYIVSQAEKAFNYILGGE